MSDVNKKERVHLFEMLLILILVVGTCFVFYGGFEQGIITEPIAILLFTAWLTGKFLQFPKQR